MKKLELKHLSAYLPYELKMCNYNKRLIFKLVNLWVSHDIAVVEDNKTWNGENHRNHGLFYKGELEFFPILRPLSDLTKEIEVNGEKFVLINKLLEHNCFDLSKMSKKEINNYIEVFMPDFISFRDSELLFKWHFDIFGLIKQNLAIDINTLEL
jgi:hypothetical protein